MSIIEMSPPVRRVNMSARPEALGGLSASAFTALAEVDLSPGDRAWLTAFSADSERVRSSPERTRQLAGELRSFMVESLSFLRTYERTYVSREARGDRNLSDFTNHIPRYSLTIALLRHLFRWLKAELGRVPRVLDVGGTGIIRTALDLDLEGIQGTGGDLRGQFYRGEHRAYDLVICTEVLEHISDKPVEYQGDTASDFNAEVRLSGIHNCLTGLREVLGPQGALFLTTPNCLSMHVARRLAERLPPCIFRPHFREYSPRELAELLRGNDFDHHLTTVQFYLTSFDLSAEIEFLMGEKKPDGDRFLGDTTVGWAFPKNAKGALREQALRYTDVMIRSCAQPFLLRYVPLDRLAADLV